MILISGGTGFVGRNLVERLAEAGKHVTCIVRPTRRMPRLPWETTVDVIPVSLDDLDALEDVMRTAHTVIHLVSAQWWGSPDDLRRIDLETTERVVEAAKAARIGRIMIISVLGADRTSAYPLLRIKGQVEEVVRDSGLPHTIFRVGIVFGPGDVFVNGIAMALRLNPIFFPIPGEGETLLHPLWIGDLVEAILNSLENLDTVDRTLEIGGPEYLTYQQTVRTVMRVSRAPRILISLPPFLLRNAAELAGQILPNPIITPQWFDILAANRTAELDSMSRYFGIRPARFEDTLMTYMRGHSYWPDLIRHMTRRPRGRL